MKVLLVTSPHLDHSVFHLGAGRSTASKSARYAQSFAPMGLVSLAGAVESEATVQIADINKSINQHVLSMSRDFYDEAAEWLLGYQSDLIGFMTESDSYHHLLRICQSIKSRKPQTLTVLGGVHATAAHYETLRDFPCVDFILRGEGENAFRSLLDTLKSGGDLTKVGNLSYRHVDEIVSTIGEPLIENLDILPFPNFSYLKLEPEDIIYLEVGRGCPFKCNFCFTAPYWQRKHRIKSPARVMRELAYFKNEYARTDFNFTHDLLTTDRRWVLEFCRTLAESDLNVTWTCSSRTDTLDEEQIYWMQRAHCRDIYFGVETGTSEMQARINKNLNLEEAERIIGRSIEAGIGATVGFIAGLPGESDTSLRGTLNEALYFLGLPKTTVHLFGFNPYRGSPHFEQIKSRLVFDDHFVDFPLSDEVHTENCELMRSHFEIFSRYSRLASYEGLDVGMIRAADEFFPMVNALRQLMLRVHTMGVDPLNILIAWTNWIASKNRRRSNLPARLYQGTVTEFLGFLETHLRSNALLDPATEEMIRWERHKDVFRSNSNLPPIVNSDDDGAMYTNPSMLTDHFERVAEFLPNSGTAKTGTFGFYARRDGTPAIVHLEEIALLILDLAKLGVDPAELLDEIEAMVDTNIAASVPGREALVMLLGELESLELLVSPSIPDELTGARNVKHEGIKQGYIPLVT
ncbi:MAG TPA: radical SAM protein [Pyrinomonadaceae bacterium]|nr:radical SAM protein [Pyrinomonadaceae bacterium]